MPNFNEKDQKRLCLGLSLSGLDEASQTGVIDAITKVFPKRCVCAHTREMFIYLKYNFVVDNEKSF